MLANIKKNALKWALALSLLLHVLAFVILGLGVDLLQLLRPLPVQAAADDEKENPITFTFAETPESARIEKKPDSKYLSDKNAQMQNPDAPEDLPVGEAYSNGLLAQAGTLSQFSPPAGAPAASNGSSSSAAEKADAAPPEKEEPAQAMASSQRTGYNASSFRREFLTGSAPAVPESSPGREQHQTRAPEFGSFSLNTYEWDFAPYLRYLKNRIQGNIYPPPAFTHMGLISGQTRLRFRIHRDGRLEGPDLLEYNGHISLMQTSMRAVQVSVPMKKLPEDFPEEFLEITAQFDYTVLKP